MNYTIEKLSNENACEYAYVNSRAWLESYQGIIDQAYLENLNTDEALKAFCEKLKGYIKDDPNNYFLLRVDGRPVGVLGIRKPKYEDYQDCGELGAIYLLNEVKGKGYGKILFEKAKEELRKMGYNKMVNGCIDGNPSNEFYKHMGGKFVKQIPFKVHNSNQELVENIYYYEKI
ncbi:MAG: GNAT family N-acetyltransferase [Bacilli bacterium]|nr:GNAT family N-acetyltransferase [Bacilli bacterium]